MAETKKLFFVTLFITVLARAMTWHEIEGIPYTAVYLLFIGFWFMMMLFDRGKRVFEIRKTPAVLIIVLLTLYFLIWGLSNIQNLDFTDTFQTMLRSLQMMAYLIVATYWITRLNCLDGAIKTVYLAMALLMLLSFVLYINEVNLLQTLRTFWLNNEQLRTRTLFGFRSNNIAAEYAMSTILLSLIVWRYHTNVDSHVFIRKVALILVDIIMVIIIIANNSRGTAIALCVICFVLALLSLYKKYAARKTVKSITKIAIIAVVGLGIYLGITGASIEQLLEVTNRTHFFDNIEALSNSGRWLMGLGTISGEYFREGHLLYGVELNYMEMYYIGVFVMSGIIGSIWMLCIIALIVYSILKISKRNETFLAKWILLVFAYMMFLSLFEGYLFSSTYVTSTFLLLFILSFISINYKLLDVKEMPNRIKVATQNNL